MKKVLLLGMFCLLATVSVNAETISGEVVKVKKNMIIVQMDNGDEMTLYTTDGTTYRQKKIHRKGKTKQGKMASVDAYYKPMVEEDDLVEITYTPAKNNMQTAEIQEVIVYDD